MGDSVTPEVAVLSNMIRQYFSPERPEKEAIRALNYLRRVLHEISPFAPEPVDCVLWVKADEVVANDYTPNVMAPGEKLPAQNVYAPTSRRYSVGSQSW